MNYSQYRNLSLALGLVLVGFVITAQTVPASKAINDGPYVFITPDGLVEKTVVEGVIIERNLPANTYPLQFDDEPSVINSVSKLVVVSDIHGQLDLFQSILQANGVIDEKLLWSFGDGHMVIVGDIFDRGPQVTEALWFVMKLDEQAKLTGGRVHFVLGNHEFMPLQNDLRYLNDKYVIASQLLNATYPELFDSNTVLGRWIRSKNTVFKIGRKLFVHGGISTEFLDRGLSLEEANGIYRDALDISRTDMKADPKYDHFHGTTCPIWHRGFFEDKMPKEDIKVILERLDVDEIIVGHTSQRKVTQLYDGLIYCVDSSIKRGKYGELLLIDGDDHFRLTPSGKKIKFD